jgi:hypothetical protein
LVLQIIKLYQHSYFDKVAPNPTDYILEEPKNTREPSCAGWSRPTPMGCFLTRNINARTAGVGA